MLFASLNFHVLVLASVISRRFRSSATTPWLPRFDFRDNGSADFVVRTSWSATTPWLPRFDFRDNGSMDFVVRTSCVVCILQCIIVEVTLEVRITALSPLFD